MEIYSLRILYELQIKIKFTAISEIGVNFVKTPGCTTLCSLPSYGFLRINSLILWDHDAALLIFNI